MGVGTVRNCENHPYVINDWLLTAKENPGKPQLGDRLMKAVRPELASKMTSVDS